MFVQENNVGIYFLNYNLEPTLTESEQGQASIGNNIMWEKYR